MPKEYVNRNVTMEGVRIIFRNFAGKEGMYNKEGDRNFAVLLDSDVAEAMVEDGWNVKYLKVREPDDEPQATLPVTIGAKGRPPRVIMITSRGRTTLGVDEWELLDWVDIETVDLIVHPSDWSVNGRSGTKAYLQAIYVTIREDALELKYADMPELGRGGEQKALEGARQSYDLEGEILEELPARAGRVDDSPPWR